MVRKAQMIELGTDLGINYIPCCSIVLMCYNVIVYEMGGLKVSDVYCGNDLADVQIAPILNKLHRLFYIRCYMSGATLKHKSLNY